MRFQRKIAIGTLREYQSSELLLKDIVAALRDIEMTANQNFDSSGRTELAAVTTSLAAGAAWQGRVTLGKVYRVLRITASGDARVRLYGTAAGQTADVGRAFGTPPAIANQVFYDAQYTAAGTALTQYPLIVGANFETPVLSSAPITVNNLGGSSAVITLNITYQTLEH